MYSFTASSQPAVSCSRCSSLLIASVVWPRDHRRRWRIETGRKIISWCFIMQATEDISEGLFCFTRNYQELNGNLCTFDFCLSFIVRFSKTEQCFQLKIVTHQLHSCFVSFGFLRHFPHATGCFVITPLLHDWRRTVVCSGGLLLGGGSNHMMLACKQSSLLWSYRHWALPSCCSDGNFYLFLFLICVSAAFSHRCTVSNGYCSLSSFSGINQLLNPLSDNLFF